MKLTLCIEQKPDAAGKYNVMIKGVRTLLPIFMEFDGQEWVWENQDARLKDWGLTREALYWFPKAI